MNNNLIRLYKEETPSDEAITALSDATGSNPLYGIDDLIHEIRIGSSTLYQVWHGDILLGYIVVWFEDFGGANSREMVVQAGAKLAAQIRAVPLVMPFLDNFARHHGAKSIRVHVESAVLASALKRVGYKKAETVLRREV